MLLVPARPLDAAELLEPRVAHAGVHRRERTQLVPDVLRASGCRGRRPSRRAELVDDLDVVARLARRVERLAHALHAPLARGDRAFRLGPAGAAGEDDVGELGRLRAGRCPARRGGRGLSSSSDARAAGRPPTAPGSRRSRRARCSSPCSIASNMPVRCRPCFGGIVAPHAASNFARSASSSTSWKPGQLVRDRAHVAAALHVVLAAQRLQPGAVAADAADEQRQVDQREARCRPRCGAR